MSMLTLGLGQFPKLGNPLLHDLDLVASLGAAESTGFMNKSCATISLYSVCSVCVCVGGDAFWRSCLEEVPFELNLEGMMVE